MALRRNSVMLQQWQETDACRRKDQYGKGLY